jgi:pimeloyl-ACP methyl ester carboxylesterase
MTQVCADYRAIPRTAESHRRFAGQKLEMPVLAIGGSHSTGRKIEQALVRSTPHTVVEIIADCGHFVRSASRGRSLTGLCHIP